ncbi:hypothetical protein WAF17_08140 [Bernardetia sp. ABR2-2B]
MKCTATSRIHIAHSAEPSESHFWTAETQQRVLNEIYFFDFVGS